MALGINFESGSGQFFPYLKYDAKAGRWFRRKEVGEDKDVDITDGFNAIFDLENVQVGWILFAAGGPPSTIMVPAGHAMPKRPSGEGWKQGFRVLAVLPKDLGGGVHEVMATAKAFLMKMDPLHDLYLDSKERKDGLLPLVEMKGSEAIETTTPHGINRNYAPKLAIRGWSKPPMDLVTARKVAPPAKEAVFHEEMDDDVPF